MNAQSDPYWLKRLTLAGTGAVAIVGVYVAVMNLPVVSGCAFYANCESESFRKPPGAMGRDIP